MQSNGNIKVCNDHNLMDTEKVLYWMNTGYLFYYSCENCTKCNKCMKKYTI